MSKPLAMIPLDDNFEQILISAERHALGRTTYIVEMTVDYIMPLIPRLADNTLYIILTDIQNADRECCGSGLGMEFDARAWRSLEQAIAKEIEKREEENPWRIKSIPAIITEEK